MNCLLKHFTNLLHFLKCFRIIIDAHLTLHVIIQIIQFSEQDKSHPALDKSPNEVLLGDRLCAVIKKELHVDAIAKNPFAWLTFSQGNTLIEVLKGYLKSLERKEEASDGIVRPCEDRKPG